MKRYISILLALVMLLTLFPVSAAAGSELKASENVKLLIKNYEGFKDTAYKLPGEDNWTIGWGHSGPDVHQGDKITPEEADVYFEQDIKVFENSVNGWNDKYGLKLNQNQFDALVSITYNFGAYWVEAYSGKWRLSNYVQSGFKDASGNRLPDREIADAFGVLSSANGEISVGLVRRRINEAEIFLYGDYRTDNTHFVYTRLNANGGTLTNGNRVAIFCKNQPYGSLPAVTRSGYNLNYWQAADGSRITNASIADVSRDLTAIWTTGPVDPTYTLTVTGGSGSGSYAAGTLVRLVPVENEGYTFDRWEVSGASVILGSDGYYYVMMPANNVTVTAIFHNRCVYGDNCPSRYFTDVSADFWAHDAIDHVVSNGMFKGTTNTTFSPGTVMTRGMIVTVLYRLDGSPDVSGFDNPFSDLEDNAYHDAILWGSHNRIANGYGDGAFKVFKANDPLPREQLAVFLHRFANYKGYDTNVYSDIGRFSDASDVGEFARESMCWAVGEGIINGTTSTTLSPKLGANRAQVATMLMRFTGGTL